MKKIFNLFKRLLKYLLRYQSTLIFKGDFPDWVSAQKKCSGYDSKHILDKTIKAVMQVKNGEGLFERDTVLFDHQQYNWMVVFGIAWVVAKNSGKLRVLDFGGSLGSVYYQHRTILNSLPDIFWGIVEQPHYVSAGENFLQSSRLRFFLTVDDFLLIHNPNIILLSSVLQYLDDPYDIFDKLSNISADLIIIDRTPFHQGIEDRVFIQEVPKQIYEASYPMWAFSKSKFMGVANKHWRLISEEISSEGEYTINGFKFSFHGMIFERRVCK
jgi:putative methyltransferase (TIGR04325 family)